MMLLFLRASLIAVPIILSGCGHTPIMSMYKLRNFDPATTDLMRLRAAVRLPKVLRPRAGSVQMIVTIWSDGDKVKRSEKYTLIRTKDAADNKQLAIFAKPGTRIYAFRLTPADVARFQLARVRIAKSIRKGEGHGSFSIDAKACRITQKLSDPLFLSTYLKTARTGEYVPLALDVDLRTEMGKPKAKNHIPRC